MMQLSVRLVPVDDTTLVIALTGELDSTTRPVLAAFLDPLPRTAVKHVLVAAGDLWFCDLNGLDQLARTHRALQEKGGRLGLAEVRPALRRLIALMTEHSHEMLPVYSSMPEALAAAGVEAYQTPAAVMVTRRHLPRMRRVSGAQTAGRLRASQEMPAPRETGTPARQAAAPPPPQPVTLPTVTLPTVIHEARALREHTARQHQAMLHRLRVTTESRSLLLATRERCDDSLRALRTSLADARAALVPVRAAPAPFRPS
ncbi:STAS domain-containing protein [Nonomuraea candida]|uniref:STAS domain-containing protein n=1 Tax=Nonomuraea candida TaxID=359159 RepID=UPI0005B98D4D|nr:STAS domain-containing protein [Nonomuraea candida]